MESIHEDGYIILRNALTENEIMYGLSCMMDKKVDYITLKKFIDTILFKTITKNTKCITEPQYVKFRFSNNNNSTDASTFHGDIYNHSELDILPIYTCLCYFDETRMEIIPGSHRKTNDWSIQSYNKKIVLPLRPGDILIFHSNIHHRGINFDKNGDRRLLQVFDVFPDMETYNKHSSKLIIVTPEIRNKTVGSFSYIISKFPMIIDTFSFFHYNIMFYDLQYKLPIMDIPPSEKKGNYVGYESARRVFIDNITIEDQNINVICDNNIKTMKHSYYYWFLGVIYIFVAIACMYIVYICWISDYNIKTRHYISKKARYFRKK